MRHETTTVYAASADPVEQVEQARAVLDGIVAGSSDAHLVPATINDLIASLSEVPEMVPTPWRDINALIGGLGPGAVYVVGARPAMGKTALGLNLAVEAARTGDTACSSRWRCRSRSCRGG